MEVNEPWEMEICVLVIAPWEMEICVCPAGTRPLAKRIPGERQLRCFECLRPYCGNMGAASDSGYQPNSPSTTAQPASDCTRNNAQKRNKRNVVYNRAQTTQHFKEPSCRAVYQMERIHKLRTEVNNAKTHGNEQARTRKWKAAAKLWIPAEDEKCITMQLDPRLVAEQYGTKQHD